MGLFSYPKGQYYFLDKQILLTNSYCNLKQKDWVKGRSAKKMKNHPKLTITVKTIAHPNPRQAIDLAANLFLKNFSNEIKKSP